MGDFLTNYGINITYILLGIAVLAAVGSSIMNLISNTKAAVITLIGIVALAVIAFIASSLASNEVTPLYEKLGIDTSTSGTVGTGLYTFYILAILTIAAVIYTEVSKIFK